VTAESAPILSVIIPAFNEEAGIASTLHRLLGVLDGLGIIYEVVVVDDGSRDRTWEKLVEARGGRAEVRLVRLTRNFGQQAALSAGMDQARGEAVAIIDADLQDPPELLAEFIAKWREGYAVVFGIRANRKEGLLRRAGYKLFYRLLGRISNVEIPRDAGDFSLMDRKVVDILRRMPERNRFLRGMRSWTGFRHAGVPYDRPERAAGKPSYSWWKLIRLALDGITSFSYVPLRLSIVLGGLVALFGVGMAVFATIWRVMQGGSVIAVGWASTVVLICVIGGTQLVVLGIIGEYLARTYDEVKQRPTYIVGELIGPEKKQ